MQHDFPSNLITPAEYHPYRGNLQAIHLWCKMFLIDCLPINYAVILMFGLFYSVVYANIIL